MHSSDLEVTENYIIIKEAMEVKSDQQVENLDFGPCSAKYCLANEITLLGCKFYPIVGVVSNLTVLSIDQYLKDAVALILFE